MEKVRPIIYSWFVDIAKITLRIFVVMLAAIPAAFIVFSLKHKFGFGAQVEFYVGLIIALLLSFPIWLIAGKLLWRNKNNIKLPTGRNKAKVRDISNVFQSNLGTPLPMPIFALLPMNPAQIETVVRYEIPQQNSNIEASSTVTVDLQNRKVAA